MVSIVRGTAEFTIPGRIIEPRDTSRWDAWDGLLYRTVKLTQDVDALRTHDGAPSNKLRLGARERGAWFALVPYASRSEYAARHALPRETSEVSWFVLRRDSIVNVGFAARLGEAPGGAPQIELIFADRPPPCVRVGSIW